jgi:hypothetical protein
LFATRNPISCKEVVPSSTLLSFTGDLLWEEAKPRDYPLFFYGNCIQWKKENPEDTLLFTTKNLVFCKEAMPSNHLFSLPWEGTQSILLSSMATSSSGKLFSSPQRTQSPVKKLCQAILFSPSKEPLTWEDARPRDAPFR